MLMVLVCCRYWSSIKNRARRIRLLSRGLVKRKLLLKSGRRNAVSAYPPISCRLQLMSYAAAPARKKKQVTPENDLYASD